MTQPNCCHDACPATVRGHDPATCAVRLAGECSGCTCRNHPNGGTGNAG